MIIIPSAEATVLGELRSELPSHSITVVPEDYEPPAGGFQTIGAAYAPTPEGREALRVAAVLARRRLGSGEGDHGARSQARGGGVRGAGEDAR